MKKLASYEHIKRGQKGVNINMRPLCKCGQRPRAVNYKKNEKTYYRSLCEICLAHGAHHGIPRWFRAGYRVKLQCEKCGFKSPHKEVFRVFHIDGNLTNTKQRNLRTVCLNCSVEVKRSDVTWRRGDLEPDF